MSAAMEPITRIGVLVFPGAAELDFAGPWDLFTFWAQRVLDPPATVLLIGPSTEPVRAMKGLQVIPDVTLEDAGRLDLIVIPGGPGTRALLADGNPLHHSLRMRAADGAVLAAVCTGALVLAAAGLLRGRPATTFPPAVDELRALDPTIEIRPDDRFVDDSDVLTTSGSAAGLDLALHLISRLDSPAAAERVAREIQYDARPPV